MITKSALIVVINNVRMLEMYTYNYYVYIYIFINNNTQSLVAKVYLFGLKHEHYSVTRWFCFNQLRYKELTETFSVQIYCPNNSPYEK